jgi:hypothetical protein
VFRNESNLGVWGNFFQLKQHVHGEYFLWACPDDWWTPDFVSSLVAALEATPGSAAALSAIEQRYADGRSETRTFAAGDDPANLSTMGLLFAIARRRNAVGRQVRYNSYIHGVVRTRCLWEAMFEDLDYLSMEAPTLMFLALLGRFVFVDRVMFRKFVNETPVAQRNPDDPAVPMRHTWVGMIKSVVAFIRYVFRSRQIRLRYKFAAILAIFPTVYRRSRQLVWNFRRRRLGTMPARERGAAPQPRR